MDPYLPFGHSTRSSRGLGTQLDHLANMPRRRDPYREEAKRLAREAELEKDTIYDLLFTRRDWNYGDPEADKHFPRVRIPGNPTTNSRALESAIQDFQRQHGVPDWKQIASAYEVSSYWFG